MKPYWNIQPNWNKTNDIRKSKDEYCLNCYRPMTYLKYIYCSSCQSLLMTKGLEPSRVKIGSIYENTIDYQQYIYRSIFKINAPLKARGIKENRIPFRIPDNIVNKSIYKLRQLILSQDNTHKQLYLQIEDTKVLKHILYRIILTYISYHKLNNHDFKSEAHFYASLISIYYTTIERFYAKRYKHVPKRIHQTRTHYKYKDKYNIVLTTDKLMELILPLHP